MSIRCRLVAIAKRTKEKVPTLLLGVQGCDSFGGECFVDAVIDVEFWGALFAPIMVAIGFIKIIAVSDGHVLVAIDTRILMAIMNDGMTS